MKAKLHAAAGTIALVTITVFWSASLWSELFLETASVAAVKSAILKGMWLLLPALAATGASGYFLGKGWRSPVVQRKLQRMKFAAANGVAVLLPSAFFLAQRAQAGAFDAAFVSVQLLELVAGAVNITLLALNFRDGLRMRRKPARAAARIA